MRAAMSVPANIVEGSAHASPREFARFLQYALASLSEVEGHVQLARDLQMLSDQDIGSLMANIVEERRMLHGLLKTVRARA
jgi:four helix bundle protein